MASLLNRKSSHGLQTNDLTPEQAKRSVVVTNIASHTTNSDIVLYFNKGDNGGGEIDKVHTPKKGTVVVTFGNMVETVLERSHELGGSELKLERFTIEEPSEVLSQVEARINFDKLDLSPQDTQSILDVLKITGVEYRNSSTCFVLSGTFTQIEAAYETIQRRVNEKSQGERNAEQTGHDTSSRLDFLASDTSNVADFKALRVEPQPMQLLNHIYKDKLQDIEENFLVKIDWVEHTSEVRIFRGSLPDRESRLDDGCDAFIDLYREFYPDKLRREEVELPKDVDEGLLHSISLSMANNPMIIEREDNKLVVYAEKRSIRKFVQSLKKKLGIISDRSSKRNRLGEDNKQPAELPQHDQHSLTRRLHHDLNNGVKLSLYQGDITDEQVDAIVNAANERLQHNGGVAAAIVQKGGREIQEESTRKIQQHGPLNVGKATFTNAGNLACRYVIHTVGPVWRKHGIEECKHLLHEACIQSLHIASVKLELSSLALTAISSGIFGMPKEICAQVMLSAVEAFSSSKEAEFSTLRDVRIVIIDKQTLSVFQEEFVKRYLSQEPSPNPVTTRESLSDEHAATPPTAQSSVDELEVLSALTDHAQSGDNDSTEGQREKNRDGNSPPNNLLKTENSVDSAVSASSMNGGPFSHQANEDFKKPDEPQSVSEEPNKEKGNESSPLEGLTNNDEGTVGNSVTGKGRGNLTTTFQISPGKEKSTTINGNTLLERTCTGHGGGRGVTITFPAPGIAVRAQQNEMRPGGEKNEGENSESSSEISQRSEMVQNPKCNNQDSDSNNPVDDYSKTIPTEKQVADESPIIHQGLKNGLTRSELMPNQGESSPQGYANGGSEDSPSAENSKKAKLNDQSTLLPKEAITQAAIESSSQGLFLPSGIKVNHRKGKPNCLMCMNFNNDPVYPINCGRDHHYCKSCFKRFLERTHVCLQCQKEDRPQGNQPPGQTWVNLTQNSLPGYEDCGVIILYFLFKEGIQGPEHPNPGRPYSPLYTSAFLPHNSEGKEVCILLQRAFESGLLFTIGKSSTTGQENKIIWNGIELKTIQSGGPTNYGYPDPSYIDRVKKQLAEKGITPSYKTGNSTTNLDCHV